jgi:hypothetical protein
MLLCRHGLGLYRGPHVRSAQVVVHVQFPLSVGGTMAETTARIVRGIIRHPQHKHQSGFRTNPHAKASLNRYVFKRLSLALVLQTRMFFNDGIRGGIRY